MAEVIKNPDASVAREIYRRQNGYEANPNINLSDYGLNDNSDYNRALRRAAKLDYGIGYQNTNRNDYDRAADKAIDKIQNNTTPYDTKLDNLVKPEYKSQYDDKIKGLVDDILNNDKFTYDVNGDALYASYSDAYRRNAKMAAEDAMGRAVTATGGYGNSYAEAAANQAYNNQMQGLSDKIPELYQLAYDRYRDSISDKYDQYSLLSDRENADYSRYRNDYADYLTDRDYLTNRADNYRNDLYQQTNMFNSLSEMAFNREKYENDKTYQDAVAAANVGNYSKLGDYLGMDMSEAKQWYDIQKGIDLYDATGIVDYLDKSGLDTTELKENIKNEKFKNDLTVAAAVFESTGDDSYLKKLGLDTSYVKKIDEYKLMAAQKAANGSSGGLGGGRSRSDSSMKQTSSRWDELETDKVFEAFVADFVGENAKYKSVKTNSMTLSYYLDNKRIKDNWSKQDCENLKEMILMLYKDGKDAYSPYTSIEFD